MEEKLFKAVQVLREYCESHSCEKCELKEMIHCDKGTNSCEIPKPYAWSEYN